MKTQDGRKLSTEALHDLRLRVVSAVEEKGMKAVEAMRVFGVGRTALFGWLKAYRAGGERDLVPSRRGRPKGQSKLKGHEAATIVRLIMDRCPDQLKLPFALWTREAVRELIVRRTGVDLSVWTVGRLLRGWGFTPQKPVRRAYERNTAAVRRWMEETYPGIRREAKAQGGEIHWGDEMGLRSDHQAGTSYGKRGKTPVIPGIGQRFGCNMVSTVTNQGKLTFMVFQERFTRTVFLRFLGRLVRQSEKKVYLIVDGHPVHRSKAVRDWVDQNRERISLYQLPGYSPDLNPDELLNNEIKPNALGRQSTVDREEMVAGVRGYLRSRQKTSEVVMRYFQHPSVAYAA